MIAFLDSEVKTIDEYDGTACSAVPCMYICPNDLMILDPNERVAISDLIIETDIEPVPVQFWIALYKERPHECPVYFNPAPKKLEFKSNAPAFIHKNFKQPLAKSGFKRGQRIER